MRMDFNEASINKRAKRQTLREGVNLIFDGCVFLQKVVFTIDKTLFIWA